MPKPIRTVKVVKKRVAKFKRHQSDRFFRVHDAWRKPKGIDSKIRRRFKGTAPMPSIGYGSNKKTRFVCPDGFKRFVINNVKELEVLMMHNRKYAATIAHGVSIKKRKEILERALQLDIKVSNANAKMRTEEEAV